MLLLVLLLKYHPVQERMLIIIIYQTISNINREQDGIELERRAFILQQLNLILLLITEIDWFREKQT